ncbi:MAG TPA: hypothetical protein VK592_04225 [Candidatus Dormibacteraeota bacterium]|nr:hypothetical protein [Candidatus Dormibacteraeota bacterium]
MPSVADLVEDHLLRSLTDPETYELGRALADHDAVAFEQFTPMAVRARVADGELYYVDLRVGPGKLTWSCSEPGGSRGEFCRHCVAAAVQTWRQAPARRSSGEAGQETGPTAGLPAAQPPTKATPQAAPAPPARPTPQAAPRPQSEAPVLPPVAAAPAAVEAPPQPAEVPPPAVGAPAVAAAAAVEPPPPEAPALPPLLSGLHAILFSPRAEELRAFLRDVLELSGIDAGEGWLIFALPPSELAVHPAPRPDQGLYLLCDDIEATLEALEARGVVRTPLREESWGFVTEIGLPDGSVLPLYQPKHPRPTQS